MEQLFLNFKDKLKKDNIDGKDCVYVDNKDSGVHVLKNYPKDIELIIDKYDNIEEIKKEYNIKNNVEVGDVYIFHSSEKYIVKPLDTFDKIVNTLGVNKEYLIFIVERRGFPLRFALYTINFYHAFYNHH